MFTMRPRQEPANLTSPDGEDLRESNLFQVLGSWRRAKKERAGDLYLVRPLSFARPQQPRTWNRLTRESDRTERQI